MEREIIEDLRIDICSIIDPREGPASLRMHSLFDVLLIALCSTIIGGDSFEAMHHFGEGKKEWLETFLELPNGIPSVSTFRRILCSIDAREFVTLLVTTAERCQLLVEKHNSVNKAKRTIAIDGKTLKGSRQACLNQPALHTVCAFDTESDLTLAQLSVDSKTNEITVIPEILELLLVKDAVVTLDAMGCQKNIAHRLNEKEAGFVFALKKNHGDFYNSLEQMFSEVPCLHNAPKELGVHTTTDGSHGRIEIRSCLAVPAIQLFGISSEWPKLQTFIAIDSTRIIGEKESLERRFYISDQPTHSALHALYIRSHWRIENNLHWILDVNYGEDSCRARVMNGHANLAILRRMALNLVKTEKTPKISKKMKQFRAGFDTALLERILFQSTVLPV
jgi:predicted transposase YbfD/YdcC